MRDSDVKKFIELPRTIKSLEKRKQKIRATLYSNNLYVHSSFLDGSVNAVSVKPDEFVITVIDYEKSLKSRIDRCKLRYKVFNHSDLTYQAYLSLPEIEKSKIKDDCFQSETFTAYHFGYTPPDEDLEIKSNDQDNLQEFIELFEMEV